MKFYTIFHFSIFSFPFSQFSIFHFFFSIFPFFHFSIFSIFPFFHFSIFPFFHFSIFPFFHFCKCCCFRWFLGSRWMNARDFLCGKYGQSYTSLSMKLSFRDSGPQLRRWCRMARRSPRSFNSMWTMRGQNLQVKKPQEHLTRHHFE